MWSKYVYNEAAETAVHLALATSLSRRTWSRALPVLQAVGDGLQSGSHERWYKILGYKAIRLSSLGYLLF